MWRLMRSRICASSISISRGRFTEISLCLRFTELSSTVILKPSCEQSPRPYPVIDFMRENYAGTARNVECRIGREFNAKAQRCEAAKEWGGKRMRRDRA